MSLLVNPTNPMQRSRLWILLVYVWFVVFGFGIHHWGGSHQHFETSVSHPSDSQASTCQHHCCHGSGGNGNSKSDSHDGDPWIEGKSSPCEGCQLWWSIAQASQSFEPIESIENLTVCGLLAEQTSFFCGACAIAWHSRGPPAV